MEKLQAIYEQLVNLQDISRDEGNGLREYKLDQGSAFAVALKHNDEVAVVQSFLSEGSVFPIHQHIESEEVLIVYSGTVTVVTEEDRFELSPGDSLHVCAGCAHFLHAKTDVKIIAVTIPPDAVAMPKKSNDGR